MEELIVNQSQLLSPEKWIESGGAVLGAMCVVQRATEFDTVGNKSSKHVCRPDTLELSKHIAAHFSPPFPTTVIM
jgi:hypothetical protein